jgi:hypothetical protein
VEEEDLTDGAEGPMTEERQIAIVKKLYHDATFSGAFSGIQTMRKALKAEKGLIINESVIAKALKEFPDYVQVSRGYRCALI